MDKNNSIKESDYWWCVWRDKGNCFNAKKNLSIKKNNHNGSINSGNIISTGHYISCNNNNEIVMFTMIIIIIISMIIIKFIPVESLPNIQRSKKHNFKIHPVLLYSLIL